jgi:hypothetical protein
MGKTLIPHFNPQTLKKTGIIIIIAGCMLSCRKEHKIIQGQGGPVTPSVTVTINENLPGYAIPSTFEGLSFETQILTTNPNFLNTNNAVLVQMIKNLGPGILRMGGGTSDEVYWSEDGHIAADSLTKDDVDRLASFSNAIGWQVLFGLNLGSNDATTAANEAFYVRNSLGVNLYAFQSGNEPDVYYYGMRPPNYIYTSYQQDWETYLATVRSKVPQAPFAGPDVAYNSNWITQFAENENANVKLIDGHYYLAGPATDPTITWQTVLTFNAKLESYLQPIKAEAAKFNLPYRVTESNNIYGGGKAGVSDVFAASLWALDAMWTVAENNGAGINFHDGVGLVYSPIVIQNDVASAGPEYYAMLAFKYASTGGTVIPANVDDPQFCSAYACTRTDGSYVFTLINKDNANPYIFKIQVGKPVSTMQISRLTAPSVTAKTGIMFAGATVNPDGTFVPNANEQSTVNGKSFEVTVPAGSAAVVTVK